MMGLTTFPYLMICRGQQRVAEVRSRKERAGTRGRRRLRGWRACRQRHPRGARLSTLPPQHLVNAALHNVHGDGKADARAGACIEQCPYVRTRHRMTRAHAMRLFLFRLKPIPVVASRRELKRWALAAVQPADGKPACAASSPPDCE